MLAGDAMMSGVAICEAKLGHKADSKAKIVCCAVEGDPHDIGKNLIVMFLNANGYEPIDLGRDVPTADVVAAFKEHQPAMATATAIWLALHKKSKQEIKEYIENQNDSIDEIINILDKKEIKDVEKAPLKETNKEESYPQKET